jgi:hypothetical protein
MSKDISRREFARIGATCAVLPSLKRLGVGQGTEQPQDVEHAAIPTLEKRIATKLRPESRAALSKALTNLDKLGEARMKHRLADCSEPSTVFHPTRAGKR